MKPALPRMTFETASGVFTADLFPDKAPKTVCYFISLARIGALDGTSIFRIVNSKNNHHNPDYPIHVIQGGLTHEQSCHLPPIEHEPTSLTGVRHLKWTLSTARFDIGQTYGSFFITMRDEPALDYAGSRHPDGQGFAAFGRVRAGQDVLEKIFSLAETAEYLAHPVPLQKVTVN